MDNKWTYKQAAIKVLSESNVPMHYRDITQFALDKGYILPDGITPWATMSARLSTDVNKGDESTFIRTEPGFYALRPRKNITLKVDNLSVKVHTSEIKVKPVNINPTLTSKQKGDVGEARIAELITLYSLKGLSCYRPISDDEGIDIVVKMRDSYNSLFVQVKTTYGNGSGRFVSTIKDAKVPNDNRFVLIFAYFNTTQGDLFDHVFCIPAQDFRQLTENKKRREHGDRVFTVGLKNPDKSKKFSEYMVEKRELANKLQEYIEQLAK